MVSSLSPSVAPPLNLPAACASVTVPTTRVPAGITLSPFTVTGDESVASKRSPSSLSFEPRVCTVLTRSTVPAGTTTVAGAGGAAGAGAGATVAGVASAPGWAAEAVEPDGWVGGAVDGAGLTVGFAGVEAELELAGAACAGG